MRTALPDKETRAMRYSNENEIVEVVRGFEDATISRDAWRHAEHLTVALHYLSFFGIDEATDKMRRGIFRLLTEGFGLDLSNEMPYHETLTVFWMKVVSDFTAARQGVSLLDKANELVATYDKDLSLRFYSRELLFSDEARARFVEGDLGPTTDLHHTDCSA